MATKTKKKVARKTPRRVSPRRTEIVVRVHAHSNPVTVPTNAELTEPMRQGTKLTIPKTWISGPQLIRLTEKTPPQQVYKRPGKGGKVFDYVTVSYVQRVLDYVFGWNWDFEIVEHGKEADHVWVLGRLTVRSSDGGSQITKTQFGRSEVKYMKDSKNMVDYGNDLKAAASDALKKCASMLGIARDIYGKSDYKEETGRGPREENAPALSAGKSPEPVEPIYCHGFAKSGCPTASELTQQEADFSTKVYGKRLCRYCQKLSPKKT